MEGGFWKRFVEILLCRIEGYRGVSIVGFCCGLLK